MINVDSFVSMVKNNNVAVRIPLKRLSSIINVFGFSMAEYCGKEKNIWCSIEPYSKINDMTYKVKLNPNNALYKGRDFYTSDLVSLINDGIFEMKIIK